MEIVTSRVLLTSADPGRLTDFYRKRIGLAVFREYPGGTVLHAGGGGLIEIPGHMSVDGPSSGAGLWLQVRNIAAARQELIGAGVAIEREPVTEPWGLVEMHVRDPDGRLLIFVEIPEDHPLRRDQRPAPTVTD